MLQVDPNTPNAEHLQSEVAELEGGILGFSQLWASMENFLASLLNSIIDAQKPLGFRIYFAPHGAEIRFAVIEAAFTGLVRGEPFAKEAQAAWDQLMKRLNSARAQRNKIAHGNVQLVLFRHKYYARIGGPIFDIEDPSPNHRSPPGMSTNDMKMAINNLSSAMEGAHSLGVVLTAIRLGAHEPAALQRIFLELAAHLKRDGAGLFSPTIPILPIQPAPSQK